MQAAHPELHAALFTQLDEAEAAAIADLMTAADQHRAAARSRQIEEQGGYAFSVGVPSAFNFGGAQ